MKKAFETYNYLAQISFKILKFALKFLDPGMIGAGRHQSL